MVLKFCFTEWSREVLLEAWMEDAIACCEKSGVVPPSSLFDNPHKAGSHGIENDLTLPSCSITPSRDIIVSDILSYYLFI